MFKKRIISTLAIAVIFASLSQISVAQAALRPTTAQKLQLQYLVEEEKLARDVYSYLAVNVTSMKFANIVKSEQTHMDLVAAVLRNYNFYNPTTVRKAGEFRDSSLQSLYNDLTARGKNGVIEAFQVGVAIETLDINDIEEIMIDPMPADMTYALSRMLAASKNHLAAFTY